MNREDRHDEVVKLALKLEEMALRCNGNDARSGLIDRVGFDDADRLFAGSGDWESALREWAYKKAERVV